MTLIVLIVSDKFEIMRIVTAIITATMCQSLYKIVTHDDSRIPLKRLLNAHINYERNSQRLE